MAPRLLNAVLVLSSLAAADDVAAIAARLDTERAREAAEQLAELGPAAKAAVPQLVAALCKEDPELQWRAGWALSRMGREAAPAAPALVLAALKEDGLPAASAYIALKRMGSAATDAVLASMQQAPEEERARYLTLLRTVEPRPEQVIPVLLPLLASDRENWEVCDILSSMGRRGGPAAPALVRLLRDDEVHIAESDALVAIGEPSVAPLRDLALDMAASPDARGTAIGLLVRIGSPGTAAAKECLGAAGEQVWDAFLTELATGGACPVAAALCPILAERASVEFVPSGIVGALLSAGPEGEAAVERALFGSETDDSSADSDAEDRRVDLTHQLGREQNSKVGPWLFRLAEPSEPKRVRVAALRALAQTRLDGDAAARAAALAERAFSEDAETACELAGNAGPAAAHLADKLRPLLTHRDPIMRASAASALCRIGNGGDAEVAILARSVEDAKAERRKAHRYRHALTCVADAGPPAAACWELLVAAMDSGDRLLQDVAVRGLVRMLPALGDNRQRAIAALGNNGSWAMLEIRRLDDVPTLVELLSVTWAGDRALDRLVALGPPAWDALVTCLDAADKDARWRAAQALLRIDLDRAEERVWPIALGALVPGNFEDLCRGRRQSVGPHLMKALSCGDEAARGNAAWLLGELGHAGAATALRGILAQDSSAAARFQALWALDAVLPAP